MQLNILILPGDGIGTEVTREAVKVLHKVAAKFHHQPVLSEGLLGGIAIHKTGGPLPQETIDLALKADATLMGAVGARQSSPSFTTIPSRAKDCWAASQFIRPAAPCPRRPSIWRSRPTRP